MKVSQQTFEDPLFVAMLQAEHWEEGFRSQSFLEHLLPLTSLQGSV
jgi:hypothetical protein